MLRRGPATLANPPGPESQSPPSRARAMPENFLREVCLTVRKTSVPGCWESSELNSMSRSGRRNMTRPWRVGYKGTETSAGWRPGGNRAAISGTGCRSQESFLNSCKPSGTAIQSWPPGLSYTRPTAFAGAGTGLIAYPSNSLIKGCVRCLTRTRPGCTALTETQADSGRPSARLYLLQVEDFCAQLAVLNAREARKMQILL